MPPSTNTARGVTLVVLSACCFGAMGMVVKLLANRIGVFELAFFRSAIGLLLLSAYLRHAGATPASDERKLLCLLYTSPSPRDRTRSRMPSSA